MRARCTLRADAPSGAALWQTHRLSVARDGAAAARRRPGCGGRPAATCHAAAASDRGVTVKVWPCARVSPKNAG